MQGGTRGREGEEGKERGEGLGQGEGEGAHSGRGFVTPGKSRVEIRHFDRLLNSNDLYHTCTCIIR